MTLDAHAAIEAAAKCPEGTRPATLANIAHCAQSAQARDNIEY